MYRLASSLAAAAILLAAAPPGIRHGANAPFADVVVTEGTSMALAVSPDARTIAIDLQGSIWTLPIAGGDARQLTDGFDDARQPAWSPDGRWIAFQGYRDGGYDIWIVAPDGSGQRKVTSGRFDDREPSWSRDGRRVAFSSDRAAGGNYDIWIADVVSGEVRRITTAPANDYMPTWSPDDSEIAFVSSRAGGDAVWIITLATGEERRHTPTGTSADAPSWGPGGALVYHASGGGGNRLEVDGRAITGSENAFPFRAGWVSPSEIVYTADGKIRRRSVNATTAAAQTIEFRATLRVNRARYERRVRDLDSRAPRRALGIVSPAISPDGQRVAFSALGDIWVMPVGGKPENITNDAHMDVEPAWSPDGSKLAYSSDKGDGGSGSGFLNLWVRDMSTGAERQITRLATSAMGAAWSPDGRRIAFLDVNGLWRRASVAVVDVATGEVTRIREPMFGPGTPTWSPDGKRVAVAAVVAYSSRFREGTNQVLMLPAAPDAGTAATFPVIPEGGIDSRVGAGPVWSPDGRSMAVVHSGVLKLVPVGADGRPSGPPRAITTEVAHAPTWTADSRRILYQSMDKLRIVDVAGGPARDVPLDLTYTPSIPTGRVVIHAGLLVDGKSATARRDVDVTIVGNRIVRVEPHSAQAHAGGARVLDASGLTVMPGLIEHHSHLQKDMGSAHGKAWLAFGITTVRSPGSTPYEAVEDREAVDAGVRIGPRIYAAGYLMEWERAYYKMSVAVVNAAHLEMELERAKALEHDMIKSYVRMPDLQQKRVIEFAHSIGIPSSSHEIYPSAFAGVDGVEHTTGTSRRGYSPKVAVSSRSYGDVAAIIGAAQMTFTPTLALSGTWLRRLIDAEPSLRGDARFDLTTPWIRPARGAVPGASAGGAPAAEAPAAPAQFNVGPIGDMILRISEAGGRVVAGTDTPNPASLHGELMAYVAAGMTPFEALRTASSSPAAALGLDAGTIEPGKIADIAIVDGNPLERITATAKVRWTIANGRVYEVSELVRPR